MSSSSSPPAGRVVVQKLTGIRETAAHLGVLLRPALLENLAAQAAFDELMDSVSEVLSLSSAAGETLVGSPASSQDQHRCETSGGKSKISSVGGRRSGFRKRSQPYSWRKVLSRTLDDGHFWRKYGQKDIQSAKYPRSYFRCTHKYDRGCKAVRHVQKSEEDPSAYTITYLGEHTCKDPSVVVVSSKDCNLITFGTNLVKIREEVPVLPSPVPSLKQGCDEEVPSNPTTVGSSPECFTVPAASEGPAVNIDAQTVPSVHDHGDVSSGFQPSSSSWEMEFMTNLFEFEDLLDFGTCYLF